MSEGRWSDLTARVLSAAVLVLIGAIEVWLGGLWFETFIAIACGLMTWELVSYGIYTNWDKHAKTLPDIRLFTETIPAQLDIEFGYILHIKKAKGKKLHYCIEHPPFKDESGEVMPAFTGELYVRTNDWQFFLGDTIWEPVADKVGPWRLVTTIEGTVLADKTFSIEEDFELPEAF